MELLFLLSLKSDTHFIHMAHLSLDQPHFTFFRATCGQCRPRRCALCTWPYLSEINLRALKGFNPHTTRLRWWSRHLFINCPPRVVAGGLTLGELRGRKGYGEHSTRWGLLSSFCSPIWGNTAGCPLQWREGQLTTWLCTVTSITFHSTSSGDAWGHMGEKWTAGNISVPRAASSLSSTRPQGEDATTARRTHPSSWLPTIQPGAEFTVRTHTGFAEVNKICSLFCEFVKGILKIYTNQILIQKWSRAGSLFQKRVLPKRVRCLH